MRSLVQVQYRPPERHAARQMAGCCALTPVCARCRNNEPPHRSKDPCDPELRGASRAWRDALEEDHDESRIPSCLASPRCPVCRVRSDGLSRRHRTSVRRRIVRPPPSCNEYYVRAILPQHARCVRSDHCLRSGPRRARVPRVPRRPRARALRGPIRINLADERGS
jgi:hypothetical protein